MKCFSQSFYVNGEVWSYHYDVVKIEKRGFPVEATQHIFYELSEGSRAEFNPNRSTYKCQSSFLITKADFFLVSLVSGTTRFRVLKNFLPASASRHSSICGSGQALYWVTALTRM